jgi:aspartyl-tRNA synthetase
MGSWGVPAPHGGFKLGKSSVNQWIGLRENLQETIDFPIKYGAFL